MENFRKFINGFHTFSTLLHDPKGQCNRVKAGPFGFQPLAYLGGGLVVLGAAAFALYNLVKGAFSTSSSNSNQLIKYILISLVLTFAAAGIELGIYLCPPTTAKNFRDRSSWPKRIERTMKNVKLVSTLYAAIAAPLALGLLLHTVRQDQINFYSNLRQASIQSGNDTVVDDIYHASRNCDQTYGLDDQFCMKISTILGTALAYQGDVHANINAIQICSGKVRYSGAISDGFEDLISVCKAFDRSQKSNIYSEQHPWVIIIQIMTAYTVCFVTGTALAGAIFDQCYQENLQDFCKRY